MLRSSDSYLQGETAQGNDLRPAVMKPVSVLVVYQHRCQKMKIVEEGYACERFVGTLYARNDAVRRE